MHIDNLVKRVTKDINLLRSVKGNNWGTDKQSRFTIYQSLIKSKLNYGSVVYNSANSGTYEKLQKVQNKALKVITSCPRNTPSALLIAECGDLPLNLNREMNMLEYWARSIGHGLNLPINEKIDKDPIFELNPKCVRSVKNPYSQEIKHLTSKYNLDKKSIVKPFYNDEFDLNAPNIDLKLTDVIFKNDKTNQNLRKTELHISKYKNSVKVYADGSKDPDKNLAGAGIVIFDETDSVILKKGVSFDHRVSIYSCEISAINIVLEWLSNRSKDMFTSTNVTIFTDSLGTLQSLTSGKSHTRPEILNQIQTRIKVLAKSGILDSEPCWYYRKRDSGSDG